jgi:hypothetical protein
MQSWLRWLNHERFTSAVSSFCGEEHKTGKWAGL